MNYSSIHIQGNLLSLEIFDKIQREQNYKYQSPRDFGLSDRSELRDVIGAAWSESRKLWERFQRKLQDMPEGDAGTTITRKIWIEQLLLELGYEVQSANAEIIGGKSYSISHRATNLDGFPVLIMGYHDKLDKKPENAKLRMSPHALMQEYLNGAEHLYGFVTNGRFLRVLRDSNRLANLAYLEFDLERIFEEDLYAEFALLFRVLHCSRMPQSRDRVEEAFLEQYHQDALDSGSRIRDGLRQAVKDAMEILATGFLEHSANTEFIQAVKGKQVDPDIFYKLLLRMVYRVIFLATIEERNLVFQKVPKADPQFNALQRWKEIYGNFYSLERLRKLAQASIYIEPAKHDLWMNLITTFKLFEAGGYGEKIGIVPLGGKLFQEAGLSEGNISFESLKVNNQRFMDFFKKLTTFRDERGVIARINYRDLDVEELGSVYEALLELHPYFNTESSQPYFGFSESSERKTTGSYYTSHDLVAQLIKSALLPVLEQRLAAARWDAAKLKGDKTAAEQAILSIKVCDPAAGSGHFLLSAARTLGFELAKVRSEEENPSEEFYLPALRDVISNCIYGVDKNPAAVELCRLSLWLVAHNSGKPLNFLDHRIKHGDSLIGIDTLQRLKEGVPDGAYKPTDGDDKKIASYFKKVNKDFKQKKQYSIFYSSNTALEENLKQFASKYEALSKVKEDSLQGTKEKREQYSKLLHDPAWLKDLTACNLFTYAFFQPYEEDRPEYLVITTENIISLLRSGGSANPQMEGEANARASKFSFFHWPLEFPDVFQNGGFDVMLGNPPWERIKLQEKEFFASKDEAIVNAANKAARDKLIKKLELANPPLFQEYKEALKYSENESRFIRDSDRYPLTGRGDVNTYSIFSELFKKNVRPGGLGGFIVPTGIATDSGNQYFFSALIEGNLLVSLFDFENRKAIFQNVHRSYKFCLLTIAGGELPKGYESQFGFFLQDVLDLKDERRVFTLTKEDFLNINPNTKTTPIFRTQQDAKLTAKIYSRVPVLVNEEKNQNSWGINFMRMFDMSNDSHLFRTEEELKEQGLALISNRYVKGSEIWLPLYESKMIFHFDHRYGSFEGIDTRQSVQAKHATEEEYQQADYLIKPWYWIKTDSILSQNNRTWQIGFRNNARTTDSRTAIFSLIPHSGVGNSMPLILLEQPPAKVLLFLGLTTSLVFDYVVRQNLSGVNMNYVYVNQFAYLPPNILDDKILTSKTLELTYTSWDIKAFADDLWKEADEGLKTAMLQQWSENKAATGGHNWDIPEWADAYPEIEWEKEIGCPLPPFKWDEERRAYLKAELDAYFALLYGLERDELRYILDPQDVYGEDFPGETFRVLKEKEIKEYGEYRTRRLVLEAYDRLRPSWDMESHLKKLKEIWEECQVDLSNAEKEEKAPSAPAKKNSKKQKQYAGDLFGE